MTDPPAGIGFMATGKDHWDSDKGGREHWIAWMRDVMAECLRVLKPGAHGLVWALPRTSHWTGTALEDAGLEVRDTVQHIFSTGFPKSLNVGKALDKMAGAERAVIGSRKLTGKARVLKGGNFDGGYDGKILNTDYALTAPATAAAKEWDGWGTALKPAVEIWWLVRKPLAARNVAANVLAYRTGAINVDASRIGARATRTLNRGTTTGKGMGYHGAAAQAVLDGGQGRWPANVLLSCCGLTPCVPGCAVAELDAQSGVSKSRASGYDLAESNNNNPTRITKNIKSGVHFADSGGASRFFYVAKPSRRERNAGCEGLEKRKTGALNMRTDSHSERNGMTTAPSGNGHPTVKPTKLMRYLITLVTPPGGTVLDCFAGSGTTCVAAKQAGFRFIGIERDPAYVKICRARIAAARAARPAPREERPAC